MLARNQSLALECTALGADFEGICRADGQVVFVPGVLPGERAQVTLIKVTKQYAIARLTRLLSAAPQRQRPPCPYFPRCGGCTAQHLAYAATLRHKRQQVADCLTRIGGFCAPDVAETLGMDDPWRYRNKGAFPVGGTPGAPRIGCFAARSHTIIDAPGGCLLQTTESDALLGAVRGWMTDRAVPPYDEAGHTGLVRHVMTRQTRDGGAMLVLAANGSALPHADDLIARARAAAPGLRSVQLSVHTRPTNVILGDTFRTLWGEDTLTDTLAGLRVRVSPRSFFQVNAPQAERLYDAALALCDLTGREQVWDLYCGCGTITLPLARRAARAIGVEVVEDAVADARVNAALAGADNAMFLTGAAEALLPGLKARYGAPDVVVLDPPRKGCEPGVIDAIAQAAPARVVYVSCNPATLARDARRLAEGGYMLGAVRPVDMFGWTGHVESVALLVRA